MLCASRSWSTFSDYISWPETRDCLYVQALICPSSQPLLAAVRRTPQAGHLAFGCTGCKLRKFRARMRYSFSHNTVSVWSQLFSDRGPNHTAPAMLPQSTAAPQPVLHRWLKGQEKGQRAAVNQEACSKENHFMFWWQNWVKMSSVKVFSFCKKEIPRLQSHVNG